VKEDNRMAKFQKDCIKTHLKEKEWNGWTGFIWSRSGRNVGVCERRN
jgi:hypothetical protein